jgi:dihydroorotate dehydrogenase electron transfer subunit
MTYLISLECGLDGFEPGQFVMLKIPSQCTFLRRPFGIMGLSRGVLALLYKIRGEGTHAMSGLKEGETVSVIGPLGTGFNAGIKGQAIYVAGGAGLPPLLALYNKTNRGEFLLGVKTEDDIPFDYIPGKTRIASEDGSIGYKGLVTDLLSGLKIKTPSVIYTCGPLPMLKEVSLIAESIGAKCQVSLEERMACGFGVCSGCVARTVKGNRSICVNGPVFDASELLW